MEGSVYTVIVKSYFTRGSRIKIVLYTNVCLRSSSQCIAIAIKSSILDIAGVVDPPLITVLGQVIFNLKQKTVILFNLIAICGRSYLTSNYEIIFY